MQPIAYHKKLKGKIAIASKVPLLSKKDLSLAYTPGVAEVSRLVHKNKQEVWNTTMKGNTIAIVTDGSAVLGLGNIGPEAALPVMEGKAALFKEFADINAFPLCLSTQNPKEIIKTVKAIAPVFGGILLEDIKAPQCFTIEDALQDLGIPVMHDDQHGTAVVVLAGLINALKVVKRKLSDVRIVVNGSGAAGIGVTRLLLSYGARGKNIIMIDSKGILYHGCKNIECNKYKRMMAKKTNPGRMKGWLKDAIVDADVFIGVSIRGALTPKMVRTMASHPILLPMANPDPEIDPARAKQAGAAIVATGRSDYPNQVNNVLGFPGLFRGALDCRASHITEHMKIAAAEALAELIKKPTADRILPDATNKAVVKVMAHAVKKAWKTNKD